MADRGTCWSITINNPTDADYPSQEKLPPGWTYEGQLEEGEQGTRHYQGMVKTPQVRFTAVKKLFPRAHIELAKNPTALKKYVHKAETRLEAKETVRSNIPTLWDYQDIISNIWAGNPEEFEEYIKEQRSYDENIALDEIALMYVDKLVSLDIRAGRRGVEYIAVNPMWRSAWKKFWKSIIFRAQGIEYGKSQTITNQGSQETTEGIKETLAEA